MLEDDDADIVYDGPLVILTSRITASASEIVAGAMKDYGRAVIVGDDHTFGKGTVQSYVNQPGRLGAIKVTTALFFRPGGASTQHEGVAADIVLPSLFATDDLGERYTPYSLKSQMIRPFLSSQTRVSTNPAPRPGGGLAWQDLSEDVVNQLRTRSAERIAENEEFKEINEQLAKFAAEDDVIHLAELIREREEQEAESNGKEGDEPKKAGEETEPAADTPDDPEESADAPEAKDYDPEESEDEKKEPTPQRKEALRILADLVELQETARSSWHAQQSASRSASPSSQP